MAIYLCRWPNGEFSIVSAINKAEAIEMLDEWGNAEQAVLTRMSNCMLDFRLTEDGQIEIANIGESTESAIMETGYPVLESALSTAEFNETGTQYSENGWAQVRKAVEFERTRLWDSQPAPKQAETELGRKIQKQTGAAGVLVDRLVRRVAKKRLKSKEGEGGKPN